MQQSSYSAMFGAMSAEHRMNMISNNLANVNTTGYKKDQLAFKDVFIRFAHDTIMEPIMNVRSEKILPKPVHIAKPRLAVSDINFEQGSMKKTDSPLDFAISGEGFFKVRTEFGDYYTRNGHFQINTNGVLMTEQGYPVLGEGGEIVVPPNTQLEANSAGQLFANGVALENLQVVTVEDLKAMEKIGHNLFALRQGSTAGELPADNASVNQGYLEAANVNVVEEMVGMIETSRSFEMYQKMTQSTSEMDQKAITRVGRDK